MHHRRPTAIAAPVLGVLLAASMSACGFHYPTDRVNTIAAGENNRTGTDANHTGVDALGIRILATGPGEGRLIGALSNDDTDPESRAALVKVGGSEANITAAQFKPVTLSSGATYNFAGPNSAPIKVSGDFGPGQVVLGLELTIQRKSSSGTSSSTIRINAPVVKPCHQYTAVPTPTEAASPSSSASSKPKGVSGPPAGGSVTQSASPTKSASPSETASPSESATPGSSESSIQGDASKGGTSAFECAAPTPGGSE